jgi:single-stranded-DNA-specific exonuclease
MSLRWQIKDPVSLDKDVYGDMNSIIAQLLSSRGICTKEQLKNFFEPKYEQLHSPFLFKDMSKAVTRVWQAILGNEKIYIYGDYDADAVTANAVLQQTFKYLGVSVKSYIPDRFTEGYGLNLEAFDFIKSEKADLVITVDCGTNSVDVAEFCLKNGIDLIITDHHEITGEVPKAFALINPKNPADTYPDDQITGVGVAYKLARAVLMDKQKVCQRLGVSEDAYVDWDKWLLDLVAIGTVADCHSLLGENRILVSYGLIVLARTKWPGLRRLMETAGVDLRNKLDTYVLGFILAPRINAAGRIEHANGALSVLMAESEEEAIKQASNLEGVNKKRQESTLRVVSEAKEQAEKYLNRKLLLVSNSEWPKGLVGLAAGRLCEEYKKPAIVLSRGEIESTGSARGNGVLSLVEALKASSSLLVKFGGHKQACGLTVLTENIDRLYEELNSFFEKNLANDFEPVLEVDAELLGSDINLQFAQTLDLLGPFGVGNLKPRFAVMNLNLVSFKFVGKDQNHVQFKFGTGHGFVSGIGFSMAGRVQNLTMDDFVDVVCELLCEEFRGVKQVKVRVLDIRNSEKFLKKEQNILMDLMYEKN